MDELAFVIIPWLTMYLMNDCRQQAVIFYDHINAAIEMTVPTRIVKVSTSDRPCILKL